MTGARDTLGGISEEQVDYTEVKRLDAPFSARQMPYYLLLAICCGIIVIKGDPGLVLAWVIAVLLAKGLHHLALARLPDTGPKRLIRRIVATQVLVGIVYGALGLGLWVSGGETQRIMSLLLLNAAVLNALSARSRLPVQLRIDLWLISVMTLLRIGWLWYQTPMTMETWMLSAALLAILIYFIHVTIDFRNMRQRLNARSSALDALARQRSMTQFTGGVAHDFNNLLTVVLGNMELARLSARDGERDELIGEAERAARRGAELTSRLLALSRNARLAPVSESPEEMMKPIPALAGRILRPEHRLDISVERNLPAVFADPTSLQAALLELITNARDAMPDGGQMTLSVNQSADAPGQAVRFSLTDAGSGVPDHLRDTVFEPYFTTKPRGQGSGLGLPMVRGFVEQSAGEMHIEPAPNGQGTRVWFDLPAVPAREGAAPRAEGMARG
ncbi:hypothetical protein KO516_15575 [Citreicella sp. C3M06]|uniref:sensor histidine kinase n=1 Tax=Citreicella sp. C3M06 TaxID=2841564 RepID=UPI001C09A189|nr:hypothetical protein [Citreicella sp. C3M06]